MKGLINIGSLPSKVLGMFGSLFEDFMGGGGGSAGGLVGFAKAAFAIFKAMFPWMTIGGWRARGSVPGSDHPKGKALDLMTGNPTMHRLLIEIGRKLPGAKYWISMNRIATALGGWKARGYNGPSPHTDHVHWSFFHRGGRLPEDIIGVGPSGRRYSLQGGETVLPRGNQIGHQGNVYHFAPGSIRLDASGIRSIQDLLAMVEGLSSTARTMGVRPRVAS
jgi:hypothetical protein